MRRIVCQPVKHDCGPLGANIDKGPSKAESFHSSVISISSAHSLGTDRLEATCQVQHDNSQHEP